MGILCIPQKAQRDAGSGRATSWLFYENIHQAGCNTRLFFLNQAGQGEIEQPKSRQTITTYLTFLDFLKHLVNTFLAVWKIIDLRKWLVTSESLEQEKRNISHLKHLICAYPEKEGYVHDCTFTLVTPFFMKPPKSRFVLQGNVLLLVNLERTLLTNTLGAFVDV